jgi:predicted  nucleic acid-binding Zn-ribbon protein
MTLGDRLQQVESHLQSLLDEVHQVREEIEHSQDDHDDTPSS